MGISPLDGTTSFSLSADYNAYSGGLAQAVGWGLVILHTEFNPQDRKVALHLCNS